MNILFLVITKRSSQKIIRDISQELVPRGHKIYIVCPYDLQDRPIQHFVEIGGINYLFVKSGYPVGRVGIFKKIKNFLTIDCAYQKALSRAIATISFDMVLYLTPPITLVKTIAWTKKRFNAITYLMLKDIFPQNAVDLGMMKKRGVMGGVFKYFRRKEKKLYSVSDYIGCMSPANVNYVLKNNKEVGQDKVGICVNCYKEEPIGQIDLREVRQRYSLPLDKMIFLYGGNLGKPQGLDYLVRVMRENKGKDDRFFLICGGGNDQHKIENYINEERPTNVKFIHSVPADEFDQISLACDVGMIFLDHRFTIPNFPSRLLSIILNAKPVLAATDKNTDLGEIITTNKFGYWCESTDTKPFNAFLDEMCAHPEQVTEMGLRARVFFENNYTQKHTVDQILDGYERVKGKKDLQESAM